MSLTNLGCDDIPDNIRCNCQQSVKFNRTSCGRKPDCNRSELVLCIFIVPWPKLLLMRIYYNRILTLFRPSSCFTAAKQPSTPLQVILFPVTDYDWRDSSILCGLCPPWAVMPRCEWLRRSTGLPTPPFPSLTRNRSSWQYVDCRSLAIWYGR
jgi:hypothetical protein